MILMKFFHGGRAEKAETKALILMSEKYYLIFIDITHSSDNP